MNNRFLFLCSAALCAGIAVQAQENPQNRMSSEVVSVEKGYDPKVKTGSKASFTPQQAPQQHEKLPVSYRTNDRAVEFDFEAQPVSALVLEGTAASAQYPNYIKGGIGYNLSTLLEGYYTHSWGKNTLSAGINHDRAERDISFFPDNSVFGHTDASASIKHAARRYDLGAYARYTYDAYTNNGSRMSDAYLSDLPTVLRHNGGTIGLLLRSNSGVRFLNHLNLEGSYLNGAMGTRDAYLKADVGLRAGKKKVMFSLDAAAGYYRNTSANGITVEAASWSGAWPAINKTTTELEHFVLLPGVSYKNGRLDLYGGVRMEIMAGNGTDETKFHILPEIKADYAVIEGLMNLYARLESGYQVQHLAELLRSNPFASPLSHAGYSREKFNVQAGISGVASSALRYEFSLSYGQTDGVPAWVLLRQAAGTGYQSAYVNAADDIKLFSVKASADYTLNASHRIGAFAQYFNADSKAFSSALYIPDFRVGASYRGSVLSDRILLSGRIAYNGSCDALVLNGQTPQWDETDGYVEFQAEAAYRFAARWSLFAQVNNTVEGKTYRYYGYDWCGVRALAGVRFNF